MQKTAEAVAALDGTAGRWLELCRASGWTERESSMRALAVVMDGIGEVDAAAIEFDEDKT